MKNQVIGRLGLAIAGALMCSYVAYGLTHPPKPRAFRYQGVNTIRNISVAFTNIDAGDQRAFPVVPRERK